MWIMHACTQKINLISLKMIWKYRQCGNNKAQLYRQSTKCSIALCLKYACALNLWMAVRSIRCIVILSSQSQITQPASAGCPQENSWLSFSGLGERDLSYFSICSHQSTHSKDIAVNIHFHGRWTLGTSFYIIVFENYYLPISPWLVWQVRT